LSGGQSLSDVIGGQIPSSMQSAPGMIRDAGIAQK
jgi:hypothetical protein